MIYVTYLLMLLHMFVGVILIAVILLQRGRGGGLAGAFGGMGGQSAFGTKAGDLFTRITIVLATVWIVLGGVCVLATSSARPDKSTFTNDSPVVKKAGEEEGGKKSDAAGDEKKAEKDLKDDALPMPSDPPKTDDKKDEKSDVKPEGDKTDEKKEEAAKDSAEKPAEKPEEPAQKPEGPKKPEGEAPKESEKK
ncbi:MAG: preprotein translocase subunit SecG [Planctomycetota bacterium]